LLGALVLGPGQVRIDPGSRPGPVYEAAGPVTTTRYFVEAARARRNHRVIGDVLTSVNGVPAEPVNSFCWDGFGSDPIEGTLTATLDPVTNTGVLDAAWVDSYGEWTLRMDYFAHPEHPSGLRVSADAEQTDLLINDAIMQNVYLHGNTLAGQPVLPTVFCFIAAWGPVTVTLNGVPFDNPFDGPFLPQWEGHVMLTNGVRGNDGTVRTVSGEIYDPMLHAAEGYTDYDDMEFHMTFHDARFPETSNVPNLFQFFYHLVFEQVNLEIKHVHPQQEQ
jgi:hypothetical protein